MIAVTDKATLDADMGPHAQAVGRYLTASVACLACVLGRDSDHLTASTLSLVSKDTQERGPTRIIHACAQGTVSYHPLIVSVLARQ